MDLFNGLRKCSLRTEETTSPLQSLYRPKTFGGGFGRGPSIGDTCHIRLTEDLTGDILVPIDIACDSRRMGVAEILVGKPIGMSTAASQSVGSIKILRASYLRMLRLPRTVSINLSMVSLLDRSNVKYGPSGAGPCLYCRLLAITLFFFAFVTITVLVTAIGADINVVAGGTVFFMV